MKILKVLEKWQLVCVYLYVLGQMNYSVIVTYKVDVDRTLIT